MATKELTRCNNRWSEAQFNSFIRSTLRKASMRWPPKNEVLTKARVSRGFYLCNSCKKTVPTTVLQENKRVRNVEVNHKIPVSIPGDWDDWGGFIERLFCDSDGLEVVCKDCHKIHTNNLKTLEELWIEVKGFSNYEVSTFGRVRHKENGLRKLVKDKYLRVRMWDFVKKDYVLHSVHRLVAEHFLPNPLNLLEVNHKDGYKYNNYITNLEWASRKDNAKHAAETGLYSSGKDHHNYKGLWITPYGEFATLDEAVKLDNVTRTTIYHRCKDENNTTYSFKKKED